MKNRVRFAWWTDEEAGLNGSDYYTRTLSSTERSRIKAYYNFDMVASTNGGYFINNLNSAASAPMKAYWDSLDLASQENIEGQGRSDDYSFQRIGIPTSGYATGASARKSAAEAAKWGGTAGGSYDPCYHSACDTRSAGSSERWGPPLHPGRPLPLPRLGQPAQPHRGHDQDRHQVVHDGLHPRPERL